MAASRRLDALQKRIALTGYLDRSDGSGVHADLPKQEEACGPVRHVLRVHMLLAACAAGGKNSTTTSLTGKEVCCAPVRAISASCNLPSL